MCEIHYFWWRGWVAINDLITINDSTSNGSKLKSNSKNLYFILFVFLVLTHMAINNLYISVDEDNVWSVFNKNIPIFFVVLTYEIFN